MEIEHHPAASAREPAEIEAGLRREARDVHAWSNGPGDMYAEHEHGYTKVLYCTHGTIDFVLADGRHVMLRAGDRLVLPPHTRHSAVVGTDGCRCVEGKLAP